MANPVIVAHYHELWLKGRNRRFFTRKLATALRQSLEGIAVERIEQPGHRFLVRLGDGAAVEAAIERVRPFGIDVSSGVETAPGQKSPHRIVEFVEAARAAWAGTQHECN